MKILVVGSGGREHALVWKIAQSPLVDKIYAAPGNAGIAGLAECVSVSADDVSSLAALAAEKRIDLTVVGPEAPLVAGIADLFDSKGLRVFGFGKSASRLEGSKVWAKEFMARHAIPTGAFEIFDDAAAARRAVGSRTPPLVIKADGLAAGKGVIIARDVPQAREAIALIMERKEFGAAGDRIVVEEFLQGEEVSILALFDGTTHRLFAPSQDHKRAYDGDEGPNTGGMGAYAPVGLYTPALAERIEREIVEPTFKGMIEEGAAGAGVLYFGLMLTEDGPKVLEYNCRFGDPETQVILPLFAGDLAEALFAAASRNLEGARFANSPAAAACVVVASGGYPGAYRKGYPIEGLEEARRRGCVVFHAGTALKNGEVVTAGGRVLGVTAAAPTLGAALDTAYRGVEAIRFADSFHRRDIGKKELARG
jgi:phosphoribosylamine---glycine ligase